MLIFFDAQVNKDFNGLTAIQQADNTLLKHAFIVSYYYILLLTLNIFGMLWPEIVQWNAT